MRLSPQDRALATEFAALTFPKERFRHAEHVRLAWVLLAEHPLLDAMQAFRSQLQAFAAHHGAHGLYNETVTCFYLLLIRERMDALPGSHGWVEFREANPDLLGPPKVFLERWYPGGSAFSPEAKAAFHPPVRAA
jgi:hypothetical protein